MKKTFIFLILIIIFLCFNVLPTVAIEPFQKSSHNPLTFISNLQSWQSVRRTQVFVRAEGSGYKMWYAGYNGHKFKIIYATSSDGLTWTDDKLLDINDSDNHDPSIIKLAQRYVMYFNSSENGGSSNFRINRIESDDGINFDKNTLREVLTPQQNWEREAVSAAFAHYNNGNYYLFYSGRDPSGWKIGLALSQDGINWTKCPNNPIISAGVSPSYFEAGGNHYLLYHLEDRTGIKYLETQDEISCNTNWINKGYLIRPDKPYDQNYITDPHLISSNDNLLLYYTGLGSDGVWQPSLATTKPFLPPTDILPVPYFSQNTQPWGPQEYDHAENLGFNNITMDRWGCAVTSIAMLLNYHNIKEFPDGTAIDPGSLNNWLKNNGGYLTGSGRDGSYSYLIWPIIGRLTQQLYDAGKSTIKLEHKRAYPGEATTQLVNDDISVRKFPDILNVQNSATSGHFIVAKGILNGTYAINDPEWNYPTLASFNNKYTQVDRYVPSNTNLSYIVIATNPNVELLITDPQGRRTGKQINEIPFATYSFENPIGNPNDNQATEQLGTGVNVFLLPQPAEGNYKVSISSATNESYTVNIATFQTNGDVDMNKSIGLVGENTTDDFNINYSQTRTTIPIRVVTFQSTIDDINEARKLNLIIDDTTARYLKEMIFGAKMTSWFRQKRIAAHLLRLFEDRLNRKRGQTIKEDTYQILLYDVTYLKAHL